MSWLFSQALVEEYLGDISSDGEQCVQSNGNPIQQAYCAPDKMTDFSRFSQFGMTYKPLTEDRGEELLMSYLEAFHAKTSPQQAKEPVSKESEAECGKKWHGSFVKYDLDSSLWKTHQCSLLGDLEPFSETWPRWGLMRDGECWEQQTLAHRTSETESGLLEKLPTPQSSDYITKKTSKSWKAKGGVNFSLANPEIQAKWPTPTASMMPCEGTVRIMRKAWQEGRVSLEEASVIAGRDVRKSQGKVEAWPTPRTRGMCGGTGHKQMLIQKLGEEQGTQMFNGGMLNPTWVEWLMGWPLEWTDLKPLEMDKYHKWLEQHGKS
jgi:hypothetical protein